MTKFRYVPDTPSLVDLLVKRFGDGTDPVEIVRQFGALAAQRDRRLEDFLNTLPAPVTPTNYWRFSSHVLDLDPTNTSNINFYEVTFTRPSDSQLFDFIIGNDGFRELTSKGNWLAQRDVNASTVSTGRALITDYVQSSSPSNFVRWSIESDGAGPYVGAMLAGGGLFMAQVPTVPTTSAFAGDFGGMAGVLFIDKPATKRRLCIQFPTGAVQVIATEP